VDKGIVSYDDFDLSEVIKSDVFPVKEKLALGRVVPRMLKQMAACDPRDPVSAAQFDDQNACEYFRKYSPRFVDYFLDPCLSLFCGYGEEDYSLAWLLWLVGSRLSWGGNHWWAFTERGVGQLTRSLGEHFARDDGATMLYHVTAQEFRVNQDNVEVDVNRHGAVETMIADAAVLAVPGTLVPNLFPGLDAERRKLFENVSYSGHHGAWYLLDEPPHEDLPATRVLLPTADGYRAVAGVWFVPTEDGRTLVVTHWKNQRSKETQDWPSDDVLADGWREVTKAFPQVRDTRIFDQYIERNDLAIARRPTGYLRALKNFRDLGPLERVTFAGDYLVNSTVGQAHWSGMRAAKELLGTWQN
jgi:oxygen-dependent protoporphyrinogen oxidase